MTSTFYKAPAQTEDKTVTGTTMVDFYILCCVFFLSANAIQEIRSSSRVTTHKRRSRSADTSTAVVITESNLPIQDSRSKKKLEEIRAYAELKEDPLSSLPKSFTLCSTIMVTNVDDLNLETTFLSLLDDQGSQLLGLWLTHSTTKSKLGIDFFQTSPPMVIGAIPPVFPNEWIRGCLWVDSLGGRGDSDTNS